MHTHTHTLTKMQMLKSALTIGFPQFLHKALCFLLNAVLKVPFAHAQIPQGCESEAPCLFPSVSIAQNNA